MAEAEKKMSSTLATARRARGQLARFTAQIVEKLEGALEEALQADPCSAEALHMVAARVASAQAQVEKLEEAVIKCQVLEDLSDEEAGADGHAVRSMELMERVNEANIKLQTAMAKALQTTATGPGAVQTDQQATFHSHAPKVQAKAPPTVHGNTDHSAFRKWRKTWDNYATITKLSSLPQPEQLAQLKGVLSPEFLAHMTHMMGIPEDTRDSITVVLDKIEGYLKSLRNVALDRYNLVNRRQRDDESFASFYSALQDLADDAGLAEMTPDTWLATLILVGIKDESTRKKLLQEVTPPDLARSRHICMMEEKAAKQSGSITSAMEGPEAYGDINKATKSQYRKERTADRDKKAPDRNRGATGGEPCGRCGSKRHAKNSHDCPAIGKKCLNCQKKGHFAKVCHGEKTQADQKSKVGSVYVASVVNATRALCNLSYVKVLVKSIGKIDQKAASITALPDSGSAANVLGIADFKKLGMSQKKLSQPKDKLTAANGLPLRILGQVQVNIRCGDRSCDTDMYVSSELSGTLLNRATCTALGILPEDFPTVHSIQKEMVQEDMPEKITRMRQRLEEEFKDVFDEKDKPLVPMMGRPMKIELKEGTIPVQHTHPRPLPFALREEVKELLDEYVKKGILKRVEEPTDWVHPMTVIRKPSGKLRLCVDLRGLNKFVKRPHHPVKTPRDAVNNVPPGCKWFTTFDASMGYFQVPLDEESQALTTFATPWGRYKHLRATMGLSSAGDEYNRRGDLALEGINNMEKIVDDVLLYDEDLSQHEKRVRTFLERCRAMGITLNPGKFQFAATEVKFGGHIVGREGTKVDPEKISAIANFPRPKNITDLRSFMGLVEQLAGYSHEVAGTMGPLRPLLSSKNAFLWNGDHTAAFEATKKVLASPPVLQQFDIERETALLTDASRTNGLGFALMQKDPKTKRWHLIECGSRFLSETETRYAMVELELLAVTWAAKKLRLFLLGLPHFTVVVDHQPLRSILDHQTLDSVDNGRLRRLKAKLAPFNFTTVWRKGKEHKIPDALSRAPVDQPTAEDAQEAEELYAAVCAIAAVSELMLDNSGPDALEDPILEDLRQAANSDPEYQALLQAIRGGFSANPDPAVKPFKKMQSSLSEDAGIALMGQRIVIPKAKRLQTLQRLHAAHQGVERTLRRARQAVFWPGITNDIRTTVEGCEACQLYRAGQPKETMRSDPAPTFIFEEIGADYCEWKGHHLVITDRLSGWSQVYSQASSPTTQSTISRFIDHFSMVGVPRSLRTDGGLQFASREFATFCQQWGVKHVMSTPHYPQSNGLAEAAVKTVKNLLKKCGGHNAKFKEALLELRNTPNAYGKSPAEIIFGKPLRSRVPAHRSAFSQEWLKSLEEYDAARAILQETTQKYYNSTARDLPPLKVGTHVRIQDRTTKLWDRIGYIVSVGRSRDYRIRLPSGRILWRNRRFIRPAPETKDEPMPSKVNSDPPPGPAMEAPRERKSTRERREPDRLRY